MKQKIKLFLALFITTLILASLTMAATHQAYWANKLTHKFHYSSCLSAKMIIHKYRIIFKSRKDALKSGYKPCLICKP